MTEREACAAEIRALADELGHDRAALVPILSALKRKYHRLDAWAMEAVAGLLHLHPVEVQGVASFYALLGDRPQGRTVIRACRTLCCAMQGQDRVLARLERELGIRCGETTADGSFTLEGANCMGLCDQAPALRMDDRACARVTPELVPALLRDGRGEAAAGLRSLPSFRARTPEAGLRAALRASPSAIIGAIKASGLQGRGGAGFPTGRKWDLAAAARGERKFIIGNADEGEPGTFKDRAILMEHPGLVFEGMTIAARAVGAREGILFLRGEYGGLREDLEAALARRREDGLLGGGVDFDIRIFMGAGAYVCGEESALIECLEGFRGEPRNRPPYPVHHGYLGCPTLVNNVETLAWAACVLGGGGVGRIFSVSGDCRTPGVYEGPGGLTVAGLLREVGGEAARAVLLGGFSGRCVPARDFHRTGLEEAPGSGAVIVLGPGRDLLAVLRNVLEFFGDESCGQCAPCRLGTPRLLEGVGRLQAGTCPGAWLDELRALAETMRAASKCGLGQGSANAFLSILANVRD